MKVISQYQEEIKEYKKAAGDIRAKAALENRDLTPDEVALRNDIFAKIERHESLIQNLQREEGIIARLDTPAAPVTQPGPRPQATSPDRPQDRFATNTEFLSAVVLAGSPSGRIDPRLFRGGAASGMSESVPSDGGFAVPSEFAAPVLTDLFETGVLASRCQTIPMSSNSLKIPGVDETSRASTLFGGVTTYWEDEADLHNASKPKLRMIELNTKKVTGLCYLTEELLQDSAAMAAWIDRSFRSAINFAVDKAIYLGTGAGQPLGILNAGCLVSVTKETGQTAKTIVAENIVKMYARMFASSVGNAVWLVNQDTLPQLFTLSLSVGTGGAPVFMPAGGLSQSPYNTILGRPVLPIEHCKTLGTVGDIAFVDLAGYILGQRGGLQSAQSIHVRFLYDELALKFTLRLDGQPFRATALTPAQGSETQSNFVVLATRA